MLASSRGLFLSNPSSNKRFAFFWRHVFEIVTYLFYPPSLPIKDPKQFSNKQVQ